jgi:hypothetical protein
VFRGSALSRSHCVMAVFLRVSMAGERHGGNDENKLFDMNCTHGTQRDASTSMKMWEKMSKDPIGGNIFEMRRP